MDGARLLNASVASDVPAATFAAEVDSVWIDFTKGLGAPIGAVLAGSRDFVSVARRYKQLFGGAMRQAGVAAAGCLYAFDHHVERLAEDHEHARLLARGLAGIDGIALRTAEPETHMIFFDVGGLGLSNREFVDRLAASGRARERRRRRHPRRQLPRRLACGDPTAKLIPHARRSPGHGGTPPPGS